MPLLSLDLAIDQSIHNLCQIHFGATATVSAAIQNIDKPDTYLEPVDGLCGAIVRRKVSASLLREIPENDIMYAMVVKPLCYFREPL